MLLLKPAGSFIVPGPSLKVTIVLPIGIAPIAVSLIRVIVGSAPR